MVSRSTGILIKELILFLSVMLVLTACSKKDNLSDDIISENEESYEELQPIWKTREITAGPDGFYYEIPERGNDGTIWLTYFFDKDTKEQYPICSKPECLHNDSSCMASSRFMEYDTGIWYYNDKLYRTKNENGYTVLYRMDTDGSNREALFEIGEADLRGENLYYLYFRDNDVYITCTRAVEGNKIYIRKRSLDGAHDEIVYENADGGYIQEGLQWYSSKLYLKECIRDENYEDGVNATRLIAYDFNTQKTEYIELGNFSGYCFSKDESYCFFYRINDGLYRRDMKTGEEKKIFESSDGSNGFDIRCIGKYLLLENRANGELYSMYVMDTDGNIVNEIPRVSNIDSVNFGNEDYIFQRGVIYIDQTPVMTYMYIPMSDIENVKEWTVFDDDMSW